MVKRLILLVAVIGILTSTYLAWIHFYVDADIRNTDRSENADLPISRVGEWGSFQLTGTPYKPPDRIIYTSPRILVDTVDSWFLVPIKVDKVVKGHSPYREGSTVVLKVHSPTLFGAEMNKQYLFTVNGDKDSSSKWQYYLTAVDQVPKDAK